MMKKMRMLFPYYGSKYSMLDDIINEINRIRQIKQTNTIIDLFGGSGCVIMNLPLEWKVNKVYNDIDTRLYTTMTCLMDKQLREKLAEKFDYSFVSRQLYDEYVGYFDNTDVKTLELTDEELRLDVAFKFLYISLTGFNAKTQGLSTSFGKPSSIYNYPKFLRKLSFERKNTIIENLDYKDVIKKYDRDDAFFYIDFPYYTERKGYEQTFEGIEQYKEVKEQLDALKGTYIMNESSRDYKQIIPIFGEPYKEIKHINVASNTKQTGEKERSMRLEGFWSNILKKEE